MKKVLIGIIIIIIVFIGFFSFKIISTKNIAVANKNSAVSKTITTQKNNIDSNSNNSNNSSSNNSEMVQEKHQGTTTLNSVKVNSNIESTNSVENKNSSNLSDSPKNENYSNPNIIGANTKVNTYGYTYATASDLKNISGIYNFNNFARGKEINALQDLSGITINSKGVVLNNDITGNNIYSSSERMKIYKVTSSAFYTIFGVTPISLGLQGNDFNIYAIGNVFIYQLPNKNIVFSFEGGAGNAINTTNNLPTSNVSKWYGVYTINNKVGQVNGVNNYGQKAVNLTGEKVIIESNEFKYKNITIKNPQYYIVKVTPNALLGTSYSGVDLTGEDADFLAVLRQGEKMSNFLYDNLPSYTGCLSGAWAAGISMPIILGPNGNVQVMNNNEEIYSTLKNR